MVYIGIKREQMSTILRVKLERKPQTAKNKSDQIQ